MIRWPFAIVTSVVLFVGAVVFWSHHTPYRVIDLPTGHAVVSYSPDNQFLLTHFEAYFYLRNANSWKEINRWPGTTRQVHGRWQFMADGTLYCLSSDVENNSGQCWLCRLAPPYQTLEKLYLANEQYEECRFRIDPLQQTMALMERLSPAANEIEKQSRSIAVRRLADGQSLFATKMTAASKANRFDYTPDGQRLLVVQEPGDDFFEPAKSRLNCYALPSGRILYSTDLGQAPFGAKLLHAADDLVTLEVRTDWKRVFSCIDSRTGAILNEIKYENISVSPGIITCDGIELIESSRSNAPSTFIGIVKLFPQQSRGFEIQHRLITDLATVFYPDQFQLTPNWILCSSMVNQCPQPWQQHVGKWLNLDRWKSSTSTRQMMAVHRQTGQVCRLFEEELNLFGNVHLGHGHTPPYCRMKRVNSAKQAHFDKLDQFQLELYDWPNTSLIFPTAVGLSPLLLLLLYSCYRWHRQRRLARRGIPT